jgi:hypothetical protein
LGFLNYMVTFKQARRIAENWVDVVTDGGAAIDRSRTKTKPYGWLFCWNSKAYLATPSDPDAALIGNVPIFVDRVNGEVLAAGPMGIDWFEKYEASIPKARLAMTPEPANWDDE